MALSYDATRMLQVRYPTYAAKWNELKAIPGLEAEFARGFSLVNEASYLSEEDGNKASLGSTGVAIMDKALNDASTNPVGFVKSNLLESMVSGNSDLATNQVKYLQQNNVPISDISNLWQENISKIEQGQQRSREGNLGPMITTLALGAMLPGIGSAIGGQLLAAGLLPAATTTAMATAIGSGLANAAIQVAQGKSTEEALKGAVMGGAAGYAGGQVGDYLVGDPGAVKNFVTSTAANIVAGSDPETAAKAALIQTGISTAADTVSKAQAADYIENLSIPDYLSAGPDLTSADVMAVFPETNPANFVGPPTDIDTTLLDLTTPSNFVGPPTGIDTTLLDLSTAAPTTQTYTYDDGSTITVNASGDVVSYTDKTETPYKGTVETPSSPLTKSQVEGIIKLGLGVAGASAAANAVQDAISSGGDAPQGGFPFTPSDISGWARPEYTQTFQGPIDLNSLFTTDNLLGGTQWAGLQGNQFANIPQVSMSDFISSIQNGKV
jgi:hypothetical protein